MAHNWSNPDPTRPFKWREASRKAVALQAADELTDEQIAAECGVTRPTLVRWNTHPEYKAEKRRLSEEIEASVFRHALAKRHKRMEILQERHAALTAIVAERRAQGKPEHAGTSSGFVVSRQKLVGSGVFAREVTELEFDIALVRSLLDVEERAMREVGAWTEKRELSGPNGGPTIPVVEIVIERAAYPDPDENEHDDEPRKPRPRRDPDAPMADGPPPPPKPPDHDEQTARARQAEAEARVARQRYRG